MEYINLSDSSLVRDGLARMMHAATGDDTPDGRFDSRFIDVEFALLIIEIAKRSEDKDDFFPGGQWAIIQSLQGRVAKELNKLFLKESNQGK